MPPRSIRSVLVQLLLLLRSLHLEKATLNSFVFFFFGIQGKSVPPDIVSPIWEKTFSQHIQETVHWMNLGFCAICF